MSTPPGTSTSPPVPRVLPAAGSRLEQLLTLREEARAAVAAAKEKLELIDAGIMADMAGSCPGAAVVDVAGSALWPALRLRWHDGSWYVPAEELRSRHRDVWDALRQQQRGHWQLHPLEGSGS